MKKFLALILALVMVFALAACGKKEEPAPAPATDAPAADAEEPAKEVKALKLGIIYTGNGYFWDKVGDGGKAKAAEMNATGDYNIEIYATGPTVAGVAGQIQLFEDMLSQGYMGIIISPSDSSALKPTIDNAADAGVPTICMDQDATESDRLCFVGTNNYHFGEMSADELARVIDKTGGVLLQTIALTSVVGAERYRGMTEALAKNYPDIEVLQAQMDAAGTMDEVAANIENLVTKNAEFKGYNINYAGGENVINVWRQRGWTAETKHCVTSDDLDAIIWAVKDGTIDSTMVQKQYNWGYEGIRIMAEYLQDGVQPEDVFETLAYACTKDLAEKNYPDVKGVD